MSTDKIKNKIDHAAGEVKEKVGEVTGNESVERDGRNQQRKADVNDAVDSVKDAAKGAAQDIKDAVGH